jgi:hypothetical protein
MNSSDFLDVQTGMKVADMLPAPYSEVAHGSLAASVWVGQMAERLGVNAASSEAIKSDPSNMEAPKPLDPAAESLQPPPLPTDALQPPPLPADAMHGLPLIPPPGAIQQTSINPFDVELPIPQFLPNLCNGIGALRIAGLEFNDMLQRAEDSVVKASTDTVAALASAIQALGRIPADVAGIGAGLVEDEATAFGRWMSTNSAQADTLPSVTIGGIGHE